MTYLLAKIGTHFELLFFKTPLKFGAKYNRTPLKFGAKYNRTPLKFGVECICEVIYMSNYLRRKIDIELSNWLKTKGHSPALISGIRQCGKSRSIKEFADCNFKYVNKINFWESPDAKSAFEGSLVVDDIIKKLSLQFTDFIFVPNQTILILDEIQDCPRARLALKSFKEDGRFEVVASGSYIGLNIEQKGNSSTPMPNGAEDIFYMKTMDFEEFLWANGYSDEQISVLLSYLKNKEPVPDNIHNKIKTLFKEYICVGGYPEVVEKYLETNNFSVAFRKNESLIFDIKGDPVKREKENGKPLFTATEISRIQKAFNLVLSFALADSKRFVLSRVSGNSNQRNDAIDYLLNSNIVFKANNVQNPSLPLAIKKIESDFKLFYADIGMMTTQCGYDTIRAIMQDTLGMNKGDVFEAAVADSLYKANIPLYYFGKNSGLEIDFVISYLGNSTLIEAKSKTGNTKSSKTVMSHPEHYGETHLIKFGDYNIGFENNILTLPYYLAFALAKDNF